MMVPPPKKKHSTEVIGLDMVPIQPRSVPLNCRFEVYDINDGLPFADASLDVVHLRFAHSGVSRAWISSGVRTEMLSRGARDG